MILLEKYLVQASQLLSTAASSIGIVSINCILIAFIDLLACQGCQLRTGDFLQKHLVQVVKYIYMGQHQLYLVLVVSKTELYIYNIFIIIIT